MIPKILKINGPSSPALIDSWRTEFESLPAMVFFGICVAVLTFLALLPAFLGLEVVVLLVLGHAPWHLYVKSHHNQERPT